MIGKVLGLPQPFPAFDGQVRCHLTCMNPSAQITAFIEPSPRLVSEELLGYHDRNRVSRCFRCVEVCARMGDIYIIDSGFGGTRRV